MIACSRQRGRVHDQVQQLLAEQEDIDALGQDQAQVEWQLQPARGEDQRGKGAGTRVRGGRAIRHAWTPDYRGILTIK
jgi:hypothetical protein